MAKFRIYNIQLLPNDEETREVGVRGYRRLIDEMRRVTARHFRSKSLLEFHHQIRTDLFLGPYDIYIEQDFAYGDFIRYTRSDNVNDLYTKQRLYKAKAGATGISNDKRIPFVFDYRTHRLAIDQGSGLLTPPKDFIHTLQRFFEPIATRLYPKHTLTVSLVAQVSALEQVFSRAVAYSTVDLKLTFPNGHDSEAMMRELRETRTQHIELRASAGRGGRMPSLPEFIKDLLRGAMTLGQAQMTFFAPKKVGNQTVTRLEKFSSQDIPLTFVTRHSDGETDANFARRSVERLRSVDDADELE
ncbi:DUF4747 family protein [Paraburkholderia sediminicola]|uniref:hypothetical protein n=1 Tax=Paraburkholderia sediminicola TaxID=458836 RepID=UPI0038BB0F5D